jgi:hypothetical protein
LVIADLPVNVNAKIINQLANGRVDTTQGIDMTKRLTATELINAINATTPSFVSHFVYQPPRVIVDNHCFSHKSSMCFHNRYPSITNTIG